MNYLTGVSSEFTTFFAERPVEEGVPIDVEYGVLHYIVGKLTGSHATIVRLSMNDLSGEPLQWEVLRLLQLGAGSVIATEEIILIKDIVDMIYHSKEQAKQALLGILRGTLEALRARPIQNPDIQIARAAQENEAEVGRLLRELGASE
jgi:hypothetical protein